MLHHYTTIDTLALILKNKKIRFNRLDRVDDLAETNSLPHNFKTYYFVSCWTHDENENIPLWHLVWSVLPMNIESVVWIAASKIVLFAFFGLLSFHSFINYLRLQSRKSLFISLFFLTLSFLCKEQAVVLPLVYLAFVYCYKSTYENTSILKALKLIIPWFALAFIFGLITLYVTIFGDGTHDIIHYPFKQRIILSFYCIYFYISNLFILYDGNLNIDNNLCENALRTIALGRKNYLFAGSHEAAQRAAMVYSFFAICKKHEVNPYQWLKYTLGKLKEREKKRHDFAVENFSRHFPLHSILRL